MDKMYVAREQLITCLELFLHDKSPVSVHSLAGNAREILEKICKERGVEAFIDHASDEFPQRKVNELYNIINEYRNCFKHNDPMREDNASLVNFADDKNDHMLLMAIYDYEKAANRMTIPMQVFQTWYFTIYPEKLVPGKRYMADKLASLRGMARDAQKFRLRELIAWAATEPGIADHPFTEL